MEKDSRADVGALSSARVQHSPTATSEKAERLFMGVVSISPR